MSRQKLREAPPVRQPGWSQATPSPSLNEEGPRRVHGSRRLGEELAARERPSTFNLRPATDGLPEEHWLAIEVNGHPVTRLSCTPVGLQELAVGWAFAEGFFDEPEGVRRVTAYHDRVSLMIDGPCAGHHRWRADVAAGYDMAAIGAADSGPLAIVGQAGAGDPSASWRLARGHLLKIVDDVFGRFGGSGTDWLHHAAVADGERVCAVARDLRRPNAVDKVIGWTLLQRLSRDRLILCLSGRVSADIAFRAWRAGIAVLVSSAVPTCEAIELAHAAGITLIGHAQATERAVYTHGWRLASRDPD